jgi:protein-L-isoaspartate(D-aspartate) O-methyltransferase
MGDCIAMNTRSLEGIGMTSLRTRERLVNRLIEQGIQRIDVLETMRTTPRHLFIDEALSHRAYEDVALPIGFNQTISQPYIVARMTETILNAAPEEARILEIGTGCGYQTAILAQHVKHVYSIERIRPLLEKTRSRLRDLKIRNVSLHCGDGNKGWLRHAPFDCIITTAAASEVPQALLDQLQEGSVLVIPVGGRELQELKLYRKEKDKISNETLESVRFVPLLGGVEN